MPKERKAYSNAFLGQVKCYLITRGWIVFGCTWMSMYSARVWCMHGIMYGGRVWCVCTAGMYGVGGGCVYSVSGGCDSMRSSVRDTLYKDIEVMDALFLYKKVCSLCFMVICGNLLLISMLCLCSFIGWFKILCKCLICCTFAEQKFA